MTDQLCICEHHREPERPRLAASGTLLCRECGQHLTRDLEDLPGLRAALAAAMVTSWGETVSDDAVPLAIAEKPIPMHPDIADLRWDMERVLGQWALIVCEDVGCSWPGDEVEQLAPLLLRRMDYVARQEFVRDVVDEVGQLARRARGHLAAHRATYTFLGRCEADGACEAGLYALEGEAVVLCEECGAEHDVARRIEWAAAVLSGVGNAREVAALTGVGWALVRKWHQRGRLARVGKDSRGHPVFRVSDVVACRDGQEVDTVSQCG